MATQTSLQERLSRAQSESMHHEVVSTDPLVVDVTNDDSGSTYMVVPQASKCSCPDHQHRGVYCKHMLYLALQEGDAGEQMRFAVNDEMAELVATKTSLEAQLREVEKQLEAFEAVQEAARESDNETRLGNGSSLDEEMGSDESEFREMLNDLQGN